MALQTYNDLVAALGAQGAIRSDQANNWPIYIALAEAQIDRELNNRPKPLRPTVARNAAFGIPAAEFANAPADFAGAISFLITSLSPNCRLEFVRPEVIDDYKEDTSLFQSELQQLFGTSTATPRWYSVQNGQFQFFPAPAVVYTASLTYRQSLPSLSAGANWLMSQHPDVYFYGALVHYGLAAQDERLEGWTAAYAKALADLDNAYPDEPESARLRMDFPLSRFGTLRWP